MTELEQRILDCAKEQMDFVESLIDDKTYSPGEPKEVICPFFCDGVTDFLVYSLKEQRFTRIEYKYATEGVTKIDGLLSESFAFCDKYETRIIEL